ncbi:pyridine nucleotide-disulfide oxidoreductase/dicluster-binding protein [Sporomusa sp.]|uniref:pyridine nucleotide-disulfide oxidoreductase/dicluster-binding protein n=1 Tax=Sporomusa sp. TaxID=2078658 RepID=UPI002BC816E1|nr:pyridine nucleotide-disulfide oxidoreductase/dicluster-binding protein [Sporomusa sp.]HWR09023.1 FAD-dependent oxidoreductase [Sporomusa sp.]
MDQKVLRQREAQCVQENPPGCTAGCPVHVDVRGVVNAVRNGDYTAGFALFHRIIPFPGIISRICDQPCQKACKRNELDDPIFIRALEKMCVDNNTNSIKITLPLPKQHKVAIIGAGLSGLTAAVELARKGYKVVVFEATALLGGSIRRFPGNKLPLEVIDADLAIMEKLALEINVNTPVMELDSLCADFDAIYLGIGKQESYLHLGLQLDDNERIKVEPVSLATSLSKVFAGGSLRRAGDDYSPITSIADGKIAAISIDRLFQNASLTANREKEGSFNTTLYTNIDGIKPEPLVCATAADGGYTKEEACAEAKRCLLCQCLECVKVCEYLAHYRAYPKRYVREIYNNLSIVMGIHHANKMINSCSLCGLCERVCPGELNMGEVCHQARQMMVDKGKMPPSAHDFALQDMQFSNSDRCTLARHQPGFTASAIVFYPGCQLAASSPHYVQKVYSFLCEKIAGGVGLMLGCCGAPANWAGQENTYQDTLHAIGQNWRTLGSPKIITACPTCYSMFKHSFPDMDVESLWTVVDRIGLPEGTAVVSLPQKLAIHDSCTTRDEVELQNSVRSIIGKLGQQMEELPLNRDTTVCCGYGGLMIYANREVAHKVINRRIKESESDYLTYCVMCRDNFASQGKRVFHLLDLIFGRDLNHLAEQAGPGYSARQENRARLKTTLLREIWGERAMEAQAKFKVIIPDSVLHIMEERMILADDVARVIEHAETSGNKLKDPESGYYIAYFQPANVTYWVTYQPQDDGFVVHNAYCHRLIITG